MQSKKTSWSLFLDSCVFAYNTSRHETTRFTPFELMYGWCATLPIYINIQENIPSETTGAYDELKEFEFEDMAKRRMKLLEDAKQNILVAQIKQKRDYYR